MTSFPAIPRQTSPRGLRRVVIVVYPDVTLLDGTGPAQVFHSATENADDLVGPYEVIVASKQGGLVTSDTGIAMETVSLEEAAATVIDTLLVAGGDGIFDLLDDDSSVEWLREQASRVRRVGSTCMGAFLTGAAGLLTGRRVTTHWRWCEELQKRHPEATVEHDAIFVRDEPIWSSAGVTAGIDLALAMVEDDYGRRLALQVARALVVYLKRPGGQSQFSAALAAQSIDDTGTFSALNDWLSENLNGDLRVERLADHAGMSPRNFARLYAARVGMTPAKVVETLRVEAAKQMIEASNKTIATIAADCGFGDIERLRRAFQRHTGTAPLQYRRRFGAQERKSL
jgi:transcriptional regulator GlxA family with amidase domain